MKFFHVADIHFGIENYGKIDAKTGIHTRLSDFARNLEIVVDRAIEEQIDFFLFCGDAYKTANPTPTQQKLLAQLMLKLYAANIPIVIIVGNHDHPLSFGKAHALDVFSYLPVDGFYVFSKPDLVVVPTKSGPVQVIGIPWPLRNHIVTSQLHRFKTHQEIAASLSEKIGLIVQELAQQIDESLPAVLAGHLTVSTGMFSGSEKCAVFGTDPLFLPSQLCLPQFDYVALGHLHKHQNLNPNHNPPLIYAGSLERIDFGERKEAKGFCRVTIEKNNENTKSCTYDFVELSTRPMIQIEVVLDAQSNQTEQIIAAINQHTITNAIVKIIYHLPEGKTDRVDLAAIYQACQTAMHVVGIFPVHKPLVRERRAALKVDMDFATLLSHYFQTKEMLKDRAPLLIEKAFVLKNESVAKENDTE